MVIYYNCIDITNMLNIKKEEINMSIIDPKKVVFETESDVVDYVSRGLPPTKKKYREFINRVSSPLSDVDVDDSEIVGDTVIIRESLFLDCDKDTLQRSLERVYANRIRNRNIILALAAVTAGAVLFGSIKSGKSKDSSDDSKKENTSMDMSPDRFPEVDI